MATTAAPASSCSMTDWPDFDIPSVCPQCLAQHEAMGGMTGQQQPKDGDVNLCIVCHGLSVYDSSLPGRLRFPTDEELAVFNADPRLRLIRAAMEVVEEKLGPPEGDYWPDR